MLRPPCRGIPKEALQIVADGYLARLTPLVKEAQAVLVCRFEEVPYSQPGHGPNPGCRVNQHGDDRPVP